MKKLMFAAAALTAGFAIADGVVSSSVVGYLQKEVASGYSMLTPSFSAIGEDAYPIDSFAVNGVGDGAAEIQVMNAAGSWIGDYFWFNEFDDGTTVYPAGWFDATGTTPADISLNPGDGVFFFTGAEGSTVQSAGEVISAAVTNNVPSGYSMIGNASPVAINADDIEIIGAGDGAAEIQVMDATGSWIGDYFWFNEFDDGTTVYPAGWFDATGSTSAELTLQPGDSVFFYTGTEGVKAVIPAAL